MNPCKQHEKEDIDRHGSGFDCVYCRVEQLEAELKEAYAEIRRINEREGVKGR